MDSTGPLTEVETTTLVALLPRQAEHLRLMGQLPGQLFFANCENGMCPALVVEIVPFTKDAQEVLLLERPANDPYFKGKLALPGSVFLKGETEEQVFKRAISEFRGVIVGEPTFVDRMHFLHGTGPTETSRGQVLELVFHVVVEKNKHILHGRSGFFPVADLPADVVDYQRLVVKKVQEFVGGKLP